MHESGTPRADVAALALQAPTDWLHAEGLEVVGSPMLVSHDQEGDLAALLFTFRAIDRSASGSTPDAWTWVARFQFQSDGQWTEVGSSRSMQPDGLAGVQDEDGRYPWQESALALLLGGSTGEPGGMFTHYRVVHADRSVHRLTFRGRELVLPPSRQAVMTWKSGDAPPEPGAGTENFEQPQAWDARGSEITLDRMP